MRTKIFLAFLVVSLLGGCSFLQDWNTFRTPGTGDAGPGDAGPGDAGACDRSCDACGVGEMCVTLPDGCVACVPAGGLSEGETCMRDEECQANLTCSTDNGACLLTCDVSTDCDVSDIGPLCIVASDGQFCFPQDCDPVFPAPGCAACIILNVQLDGTEVSTQCLPGGLAPLDPCQPGVDFCVDGHGCFPDVSGIERCLPYCYAADGCPGGGVCTALSTAGGDTLTYGFEPIGFCPAPSMGGCNGDAECVVDTHCVFAGDTANSYCGIGCASDAECNAVGFDVCQDVDGDSRRECI